MVPPSLLSSRSYNWTKCVLDQYKHYSRNLASRDRSILVRGGFASSNYWCRLCFNCRLFLLTPVKVKYNCRNKSTQNGVLSNIFGDYCLYWFSTVGNCLCQYFLLQVLQMHFLTVCWNLIAYGSAFFTGYIRKVVGLRFFIKVVVSHFKQLCVLMLDLIAVYFV